METRHVELRLLASPARYDRLPLVVHVEHELRCLLPRIAEELLENVSDVGHQVDGVVPHDDDPEAGRLLDVFVGWPVDLDGRNGRAGGAHSFIFLNSSCAPRPPRRAWQPTLRPNQPSRRAP